MSHYRGRFAPSPTGPLHFGSLVCGVASFLQARSHKGQWLLRMEDLDPPREVPGAASDILRTLERYGLHWDETVLYQSTRHPAYEDALEQLRQQHLCYPCTCSRKTIKTNRRKANVYPGTCRTKSGSRQANASIRVKLHDKLIEFKDILQGPQQQNVYQEVGDFVLKRADGLYAYQLAVVLDDHHQGITEIVRGADLLDNTARQIYLQTLLGLSKPQYLHIPIATNAAGEKLSKQTFADPIHKHSPVFAWIKALQFLGLQPPQETTDADLEALIQWAIQHWQLGHIPKVHRLSIED